LRLALLLLTSGGGGGNGSGCSGGGRGDGDRGSLRGRSRLVELLIPPATLLLAGVAPRVAVSHVQNRRLGGFLPAQGTGGKEGGGHGRRAPSHSSPAAGLALVVLVFLEGRRGAAGTAAARRQAI